METDVMEIIVNGIIYVPKPEVQEVCTDNYCIVRTYSAGVFAGNLHSRDGDEAVVKNARRLWYWSGASSLSQLAMEGVSNPGECKFPCEVSEVTLLKVIEIIPCTEKARKSISEVIVWKS